MSGLNFFSWFAFRKLNNFRYFREFFGEISQPYYLHFEISGIVSPKCHRRLQVQKGPILLFAPYQVSYKNILKSFRLRHDATTSSKLHPLLLSDEPTALVTLDLNYVLINKLTSPRDPFDAAKIALPAAISPTAVQIIPFLPLGK